MVRIPGLVRRSPYAKRGVELTQDGWELINHCRKMHSIRTDPTLDEETRAYMLASQREGYDPGMLLRTASRKPVI